MTDGAVLIIFPTLPQATTIAELHLMEERRVDKVEDLEHTIWQPFGGGKRKASVSGGQTGERALVQEEQMAPLFTPGKISLNR